MKLVILLLISGIAFGQIDTSWIRVYGDSSSSSGSSTLYGIAFYRQDTARVIMLCSDTSKQKGKPWKNVYRMADGGTLTTTGNDGYSAMCFWLFGYSVTQINQPTKYLNKNKKPLKKECVVWISIGTGRKGFGPWLLVNNFD